MRDLRLFAVTSGWDGPFQLSEVVVVAASADSAIAHAEDAFADANQPICRAKMKIAELGAIAEGTVVGPTECGAPLHHAQWRTVDRRCDPESELSSG
ncbi:MAG: hypothetical protein OEM67_13300 [Thermoleophilia bacterium]|nr:hypothetical protein [Thermoleophilia bacterium]MDH3724235.1 hypothetical protein [Thermoleophilia bacterium]